jgi:hypothetical protein
VPILALVALRVAAEGDEVKASTKAERALIQAALEWERQREGESGICPRRAKCPQCEIIRAARAVKRERGAR